MLQGIPLNFKPLQFNIGQITLDFLLDYLMKSNALSSILKLNAISQTPR